MLPKNLRILTTLLARLPGIGEKTAQRLALHLVADGRDLALQLGAAIADTATHVQPCTQCGNIAEVVPEAQGPTLCEICHDSRRDRHLLCVVHRIQDLLAIEASGSMRGQYFVLGRLLSPLDGIGPDELPLANLETLLRTHQVREVILATPPSVDGEATALFLARHLAHPDRRVTRIASGIPHGGELEYTDRITLGRAITGRRGVEDPE